MDELRPSQLELMRMHAEALYTHDDGSRIKSVNEPGGGVASRFFLGRTISGNLWRFRTDLPGDLVADLERLCRGEPETDALSKTPNRRGGIATPLAGVPNADRAGPGWSDLLVLDGRCSSRATGRDQRDKCQSPSWGTRRLVSGRALPTSFHGDG